MPHLKMSLVQPNSSDDAAECSHLLAVPIAIPSSSAPPPFHHLAGVDVHADDSLGHLNLTLEGIAR
jgi:hypothetical protein